MSAATHGGHDAGVATERCDSLGDAVKERLPVLGLLVLGHLSSPQAAGPLADPFVQEMGPRHRRE